MLLHRLDENSSERSRKGRELPKPDAECDYFRAQSPEPQSAQLKSESAQTSSQLNEKISGLEGSPEVALPPRRGILPKHTQQVVQGLLFATLYLQRQAHGHLIPLDQKVLSHVEPNFPSQGLLPISQQRLPPTDCPFLKGKSLASETTDIRKC